MDKQQAIEDNSKTTHPIAMTSHLIICPSKAISFQRNHQLLSSHRGAGVIFARLFTQVPASLAQLTTFISPDIVSRQFNRVYRDLWTTTGHCSETSRPVWKLSYTNVCSKNNSGKNGCMPWPRGLLCLSIDKNMFQPHRTCDHHKFWVQFSNVVDYHVSERLEALTTLKSTGTPIPLSIRLLQQS